MSLDRSRPPAPTAPVHIDLPEPETWTTDQGIQVLFVRDTTFPTLRLRVLIPAGNIYEPDELPGLADIMGSLLDEGAGEYDSAGFAEALNGLGSRLSVSVDAEWLQVSMAALSENIAPSFELLRQLLFEPRFDERELQTLLQQQRDALKANRADVGFLSSLQLYGMMYRGHRYQHAHILEPTLDAANRSMLADYHRQMMSPKGAVIVAFGDIERAALETELGKALSGWPAEAKSDVDRGKVDYQAAGSLIVVDRPGSVQSMITLAKPSITLRDPDYMPLFVYNHVLGGGASGKLFEVLRQERGYTYGAYSNVTFNLDAGHWAASAQVRTDVTGDALNAAREVISEMATSGPSEEAVRQAKQGLSGRFALAFEDPGFALTLLIRERFYSLPHDYYPNYEQRLDALTQAQILSAGQKHVDLGQMAMIVVGDAESILPQLGSFGKPVVLDAMLQPK